MSELRNDIERERRVEGHKEGRFLRSLNAMYRHLDFIMKVAEDELNLAKDEFNQS